MPTYTYRLTARPAVAEHCPPGYVSLCPYDPPSAGNFGTVTYAEPLPQSVAKHWDLFPVSNPRVRARWKGQLWSLGELVPPETEYAYLSGQMDRSDLLKTLEEHMRSFGIADPIELESV